MEEIERTFVESMLTHAKRFVANSLADHPEWSEEFVKGFAQGVGESTRVFVEVHLRRNEQATTIQS